MKEKQIFWQIWITLEKTSLKWAPVHDSLPGVCMGSDDCQFVVVIQH